MRTGIEQYNKENMKHTDTQVKQVLPDKDSKVMEANYFYISILFTTIPCTLVSVDSQPKEYLASYSPIS
ncbi:hypothetical protein EB796_024933 [Bugula neritina]|uniref:Uncharacterized protein n=1 Tax=Bugula neritina TaxID=10212 RepID=A0A7J7IS94_BUGNE|nr:hypothetical protein EB796_024933 [Bugula neritina]